MAANSRGRCAAAIPSGTPMSAEDDGGDHHQGQRLERRLPVALIQDEQQRQHHERGERPGAAQEPGQRADGEDQEGRGQRRAAAPSRRRPCRVWRSEMPSNSKVPCALMVSMATVMASPTGILWLTIHCSNPPGADGGCDCARAPLRRAAVEGTHALEPASSPSSRIEPSASGGRDIRLLVPIQDPGHHLAFAAQGELEIREQPAHVRAFARRSRCASPCRWSRRRSSGRTPRRRRSGT